MRLRKLGVPWLVATAVAVIGLPGTAFAAPPATFVFAGSGYGHGVGLSQWGAYGQALEGATATAIVDHYYTGTTVGSVNDVVDLRVNLLHAVPVASLRTESVGAGGG